MIKLMHLLKEIGETSKEPYEYTRKVSKTRASLGATFEEVVFTWVTENNVKYSAFIEKNKIGKTDYWEYRTDFAIGIGSNLNYTSSGKDVKTGNIFRIMATMVDIIKNELDIDEKDGKKIKQINIEPSKGFRADKRRNTIYQAYIQKNMPSGSEVKSTGNKIKVILPLKKL